MKHFLPLLVLAFTAHAEDWPQFRGSNASGISSSKGIPVSFSADTHVAWKARVGEGIGSPVTMNGRVFTVAMTAEQKATGLAFDTTTGK